MVKTRRPTKYPVTAPTFYPSRLAIIPMNSTKRGIVGKAFTKNEIVVADSSVEISDLMEQEEKNFEALRLPTI